jgi:quercetin dioxygenase-like cupin family protein
MNKLTMGLLLCAAAFLTAVSCSNQQPINTEKTKMETTENKNEDGIFPKGERAPAAYFTGTVYLQMLAQKTENNNYSVSSVTFEPGARSNWHAHPAGQTLIVINGKGLYQEKGRPIKTINKGETIICNPDIEHWHGASSESQMTHIAITNDKGDGGVVWLKPVTDEEYNAGGK